MLLSYNSVRIVTTKAKKLFSYAANKLLSRHQRGFRGIEMYCLFFLTSCSTEIFSVFISVCVCVCESILVMCVKYSVECVRAFQ